MKPILVFWNSWLRINPLVAKLSSRSFQFLEKKKNLEKKEIWKKKNLKKKKKKKKKSEKKKRFFFFLEKKEKENNTLISSFWIKRFIVSGWLFQYVNKLSYEVQKKVDNDCVDSCYI